MWAVILRQAAMENGLYYNRCEQKRAKYIYQQCYRQQLNGCILQQSFVRGHSDATAKFFWLYAAMCDAYKKHQTLQKQ